MGSQERLSNLQDQLLSTYEKLKMTRETALEARLLVAKLEDELVNIGRDIEEEVRNG